MPKRSSDAVRPPPPPPYLRLPPRPLPLDNALKKPPPPPWPSRANKPYPPIPLHHDKPILWLLEFTRGYTYTNPINLYVERDRASDEVAPEADEMEEEEKEGAEAEAESESEAEAEAEIGSDPESYPSQPSQPSQQSYSQLSVASNESTKSFYSARSMRSQAEDDDEDDTEEASPPAEEASPPAEEASPQPPIRYKIMTKSDRSFKYSGFYNYPARQRQGWGNMIWNIGDLTSDDGWRDGDRYHGYWDKGLMHGPGVLVEYNEEGEYLGTFVGIYENGIRKEGLYWWKDGSVYKGQWDENDGMTGKGTMWTLVEEEGPVYDIYIGDWVEKSRNGKGTYYWKGGRDVFDGTWNINRERGVMTYENGYTYDGTWGTPPIGGGGLEERMLDCRVYGPDADGEIEYKGFFMQWRNLYTVPDADNTSYDLYMMMKIDGTQIRAYIDENGVCHELNDDDEDASDDDDEFDYEESPSQSSESQMSQASVASSVPSVASSARSFASFAPSVASSARSVASSWESPVGRARRHPPRLPHVRRLVRGVFVDRRNMGAEGGGRNKTRKSKGKKKGTRKSKGKNKQKGTRKSKGKNKQKGTRKSKGKKKQKGTRKRKQIQKRKPNRTKKLIR